MRWSAILLILLWASTAQALTLAWDAPTSPVDHYHVTIDTNAPVTLPGTATTYALPSTWTAAPHTFKVEACTILEVCAATTLKIDVPPTPVARVACVVQSLTIKVASTTAEATLNTRLTALTAQGWRPTVSVPGGFLVLERCAP